MEGNGARAPATHKAMRQRLERVESSLNAIPPAMEEAVLGLETHCTAGVKLASLLEQVLQDSPLLLLALRYKESCETLLDKTSRAELAMRGELVAPVKKLGPSVSRLRSRIDSHSKATARHENCRRQLEGATLSVSTSRSKQDQVEARFRSSAQEFAQEDEQLSLANIEFSQMKNELMGGCFLGYLEVVSRVMVMASDLLGPLRSYKELRHDLRDSPASSILKEATVSWLAATQVNQSLRSFGGLSRNDVQCMLYQHPDGLPHTIRSGLNSKVDQLLKMYSSELSRVETPHHVLTGGFHFNPKAIELALKDCCSELEAKGAGADHAYTLEAKAEQIMCDVPRTVYLIGGQEFGAATGEHAATNVREKKAAVKELLEALLEETELQLPQLARNRDQLLEDYSQHILNESCTTVTNTTAKTAVQLVFGKANLVLVRPSPATNDSQPVRISLRKLDSTITITVHSSWWLVEDYAAFAVLQRPVDPSACLGAVDACYTISLSLKNYGSDSPFPELPSVSVIYRQPPSSAHSPASSSPPSLSVGSREKEKLLGSFTILRNKFRNISQKTRGRLEGVVSPRSGPSLRTYIDTAPESEGVSGEGGDDGEEEERGGGKTDPGAGPLSIGVPRYSAGRSDSIGRGVRPGYRVGLRRSGSDDTMSSQSTLVPPSSFLLQSEDHPLGIADLIHTSQPTLTLSRIQAHDKYRSHSYRGFRGDGGKREKEMEERESREDDDQRTIEGSPGISIASEMDLERVFSLLSSNNPRNFDDSHYGRKTGYPATKKAGFDDRHGNNYPEREGRYKYGYGVYPPGYGVEGAGYPEEEGKKERDACSSGSSGIEDTHRSRSGSAASLHPPEGGGHRGAPPAGSSISLDSGVGGAGQGGDERRRHGNQDLPIAHLSKGLGSLIPSDQPFGYPAIFDMDKPPVSSSSSGGSSPVMFRTRSEENIRHPERSASRSSTHSMPPPGALHGSTSSLNDFDHTPGSRPRPFDYSGHLPQDSLEERYWKPPPPEHFTHPPYNYGGPHGAPHGGPPGGPHGAPHGGPPGGPHGAPHGPPGGPHGGPHHGGPHHGGPHGGPFNYDGSYGDERRVMQRPGMRRPDDFSPSPGPMDHRHPPYWHGPPQGGPPPPQISLPHPPPGTRLHPPGPPHPMQDNRFQFRPIAPSTPSPAMSPGPSPHPTPPPTPPPPHGHQRPPHPPIPPPYHPSQPPPHMHPPPRDFGPPPPMGPPHGYRGPMPPRDQNFGPPPRFGPPPPVSGPGGRFPPPGPSWDHPSWRPH